MSATTTEPAGPSTIDISGTPGIPMTRLVSVELRKLTDTRAGKWLLIAIAVVIALVMLIFWLNASASDRVFYNFMGTTAGVESYLLPVLGVLLVTSEWTQRTALTTFTLVPVRRRVIAAKVIAAVVAGLVALVVASVIATVATFLGGADQPWAHIGPDDFGKFALTQVTSVLLGLAFGLLFLNSAAAIVVYFVLPIAFTIVANLWSALNKAAPWIDLNTAQTPLQSSGHVTGHEWAEIACATVIWVVLPFLLGLVRMLRAEVK